MSSDFTTDKIGFASYLVLLGEPLKQVQAKTRNRAFFTFDIVAERAQQLELDYTRSEHFRFFESFKYLRDRTIKGAL
jgi:hypothetical protein